MDSLGRYYTQSNFSELLIQSLQIEHPNTVIDLGVGGGALLKAAHSRWNEAQLIAADIDKKSVKKLNSDMPFVRAYHADGLKLNIDKTLLLSKSTIDIAVCNPPYLQIKEKKIFESLFIEANLEECLKLNKITSDIIFLAQNIRLLRKHGELGIILPDNVLTGHDFSPLRSAILQNHKVKAIIELPERIFSKTEAKTHIALIEKGGKTEAKIPLFIAGKDGKCFDQIEISSSSLENRMDFTYHKTVSHIGKANKKLKDFSFELKRGNNTNAELKKMDIDYLHSTSFKNGDKIKCKSSQKLPTKPNSVFADEGDIIITRVGRGCVGKSAFVERGRIVISDCLYVIKADKKIITSLWNFINSAFGKEWLKASSHGVCSKVLSKGDILNIPIT